MEVNLLKNRKHLWTKQEFTVKVGGQSLKAEVNLLKNGKDSRTELEIIIKVGGENYMKKFQQFASLHPDLCCVWELNSELIPYSRNHCSGI